MLMISQFLVHRVNLMNQKQYYFAFYQIAEFYLTRRLQVSWWVAIRYQAYVAPRTHIHTRGHPGAAQ